MPLILIPLVLLAFVLLVVLLIPVSLVQRYRVGTSRRRGRGWVASINLFGMAFSAVLFLGITALLNFWIPDAFRSALAGMAGGAVLGLVGLALTRWEQSPDGLHYTPNRWLTLLIILAVTARLLYGFWRSWHAWSAADGDTSWLQASGAADSLAVGALVLGYYFTYSVGIWHRTRPSALRSRR